MVDCDFLVKTEGAGLSGLLSHVVASFSSLDG